MKECATYVIITAKDATIDGEKEAVGAVDG